MATSATSRNGLGLAHWMQRVLEECQKASQDFSTDPVHDLRVALRRCRSIADGLSTLDPHPAWKKMKKAGKRVFQQLGALRDVQVMEEWVQRLGAAEDPVTVSLLTHLKTQEQTQKLEAAAALHLFDRKQWAQWVEVLPARTEHVQIGGIAFRHLALERWKAARALHSQALRNRTKTSFHRVRIGLKKFRYIIENFIPELHHSWGDDLKHVQDWLGEIHDLDVLWAEAIQTKVFPDLEHRMRWQSIIKAERDQRIAKYRERMLGQGSLWQAWRRALPEGDQVEEGALERLRIWASFLDPDAAHALRVSKLALQIYDGLTRNGHVRKNRQHPRARSILQVAALLHEVGRAKREKNHHKVSYKLISRLDAPLGWQPRELQLAGLVARYHRGVLPSVNNRQFAGLPEGQKRQAALLAGILRLTDAVDRQYGGKVKNLRVEETGECITLWAEGNLSAATPSERIAAARYLLETTYECPILVRPVVGAA